VSWTIGALFIGWFYGVPLHAKELATIAFAAIFLAFASPGIPRGAFIMLTPLFLAIGLPAEGIGILIAVDAVPDTLATVLNVTGDLAAAAIVARGERATADVGHPVGLDELHSMSSVSIHAPTNL
jgi:proton glutamate symport protein